MYKNTPTINQPAKFLISGIFRKIQTIEPEINRQAGQSMEQQCRDEAFRRKYLLWQDKTTQ